MITIKMVMTQMISDKVTFVEADDYGDPILDSDYKLVISFGQWYNMEKPTEFELDFKLP